MAEMPVRRVAISNTARNHIFTTAFPPRAAT
jgi:hypothetical protein